MATILDSCFFCAGNSRLLTGLIALGITFTLFFCPLRASAAPAPLPRLQMPEIYRGSWTGNIDSSRIILSFKTCVSRIEKPYCKFDLQIIEESGLVFTVRGNTLWQNGTWDFGKEGTLVVTKKNNLTMPLFVANYADEAPTCRKSGDGELTLNFDYKWTNDKKDADAGEYFSVQGGKTLLQRIQPVCHESQDVAYISCEDVETPDAETQTVVEYDEASESQELSIQILDAYETVEDYGRISYVEEPGSSSYGEQPALAINPGQTADVKQDEMPLVNEIQESSSPIGEQAPDPIFEPSSSESDIRQPIATKSEILLRY